MLNHGTTRPSFLLSVVAAGHQLRATQNEPRRGKKKQERNKRHDRAYLQDKHVSYGDNEEIVKSFKEDGFVVVTNVLTPEEISTCLQELWTSPRLLGRPGIDRNDPETWHGDGDGNWPQQNGGINFVGSSDVFQDAASWDLSGHSRIVELQRLLYGRDDIMCSTFGRWGVMRPTAGHPEWRTRESWLHWDQNPWVEPDFIRLQAIVCLTDNTAESGGFVCVPGFHHRFLEWGQDHPLGSVVSASGSVSLDEGYGVNQPFPVPADDPCQQQIVRVLAPACSMIIWDSRLPHQNFPNTHQTDLRIVHYCMMEVKSDAVVRERKEFLRRKRIVMGALGVKGLRFPHSLTPLGKDVNCLVDNDENDEIDASDLPDGVMEAIPLVIEAGKAEERGDIPGAIRNHQKALRLWADIESWHDAIL